MACQAPTSDSIGLGNDLEKLGLLGLSGLQNLLGVVSSTDVSPGAMIQLQQLGSMFCASGAHMARIPQILKRCPSRRLERLGLAVGWRKRDSCSYLADTSGGRTISLIILCLTNLFPIQACGAILQQLSEELLPPARCHATSEQLTGVCELVANKVAMLDFPGVLARESTRILMLCHQSGKSQPKDLLARLSDEKMVKLLAAFSTVLEDPDEILRITGSACQAYIVALAMFLCPADCIVTVYGICVHRGKRQRIWMDISTEAAISISQVTTIDSLSLRIDDSCSLPASHHTLENWVQLPTVPLRYRWCGFLSHSLDLIFASSGFCCTKDVKILFGRFILAALFEPEAYLHGRTNPDIESEDLVQSLKIFSQAIGRDLTESGIRIASLLERLLEIDSLETHHSSLEKLNPCSAFVSEVSLILGCCACSPVLPALQNGFCTDLTAKSGPCFIRHRKWESLSQLFRVAIAACFVNASPDTVLHVSEFYGQSTAPYNAPYIQPSDIFSFSVDLSDIRDTLWHLVSPKAVAEHNDIRLGVGNGSSVIYPAPLTRLALHPDLRLEYLLVDGSFDLNGRSYTLLTDGSYQSSGRQAGLQARRLQAERLSPSSTSAYDGGILIAKESHQRIEISATVRVDGVSNEVSLACCLNGSHRVLLTNPCHHLRRAAMEIPAETPGIKVFECGVNRFDHPLQYRDTDRKIYMVMSGSSRQSQFFCFEDLGWKMKSGINVGSGFVVNKCCLDCAVAQGLALPDGAGSLRDVYVFV